MHILQAIGLISVAVTPTFTGYFVCLKMCTLHVHGNERSNKKMAVHLEPQYGEDEEEKKYHKNETIQCILFLKKTFQFKKV